MIYTPMTKTAMRIMLKAHEGQLDKGGMPYAAHPFYVACCMGDEVTCTAALLHDVLEDTDMTPQQLLEAGICERAVEIVGLLTHRDNEDYFDYIRRIKPDPQAAAVKLADLRHNSDLGRLEQVSDRDRIRIEKYKKAIKLLEE